jgi:diadenosine tetraphosphate (Ap4A) HIT family hydrolase
MDCPFCDTAGIDLIHESELVRAVLDRFPVSPGHALLLTKRHVPTWFEASAEEQRALIEAIEPTRRAVERGLKRAPDGWNVGFNAGEAAGQTVLHLHVHLIPRWRGDVEDPRGGVRGVIPERRLYPQTGRFT